jgi:hypothetical protein
VHVHELCCSANLFCLHLVNPHLFRRRQRGHNAQLTGVLNPGGKAFVVYRGCVGQLYTLCLPVLNVVESAKANL